MKTAVAIEADYIAVSFPKNREDMYMARQLLRAAGGRALLVAKIERAEAIPALEEIIDASDAIMVARGDLAIEVGNASVPGLQKRMIRLARERNKLTITATQMMESMIVNPVPTRAEVSDVANAVLDGTDAVMLSAETAAGRYPVETVEAMSQICIEAEKTDVVELERDFLDRTFTRIDQSVAMAALFTAYHLRVKAIAALTQSGSTALWMSRHNCGCPIFALTPEVSSQRKMALFRNVRPLFLDQSSDRDAVLRAAEGLLVEKGQVQRRRPHRAYHRRADGQVRRHQRAQDRARRRAPVARTRETADGGPASRVATSGPQRILIPHAGPCLHDGLMHGDEPAAPRIAVDQYRDRAPAMVTAGDYRRLCPAWHPHDLALARPGRGHGPRADRATPA